MSQGMTITEMLGQSGLLTLLGMSVVFGFIIVLIVCMKLLQLFVHACKLDKEKNVDSVSVPQKTDDGAVVAAIAAAIREKESV